MESSASLPSSLEGEGSSDRIPGLTPPEIRNPYGFGLPPSLIAKDDFHEKVWHKWMEPIEIEKTLGLPEITEFPISVFNQFLVPDPSRLAEACVSKVVIGTLMGKLSLTHTLLYTHTHTHTQTNKQEV